MPDTSVDIQPIAFTPSALEQLKRIKAEQGIPKEHGLRVGVKGGGCSGFSYLLGYRAGPVRTGAEFGHGAQIVLLWIR